MIKKSNALFLILILVVFITSCSSVTGTRVKDGEKPVEDPLASNTLPYEALNPKGFDTAAYAKIDGLCQGIIDAGNTPGVVLLIGRDDEILMRKVYGSRMVKPLRQPMTFDTIFDLASITKASATATAVMLLVQDGRLNLDDPVTKYLPGYARDDMADITISQLLTHTSGLWPYTSYSDLLRDFGPGPNPFGLFKGIMREKRFAPPNESYKYSCLNYHTLSRVVHEVIGMRMDKYLKERLWEPLGMKDTTFYPTEEQKGRCAPTIFDDKEFRQGKVHDPLAFYSVGDTYTPGNAGAFSTVGDMSLYARMLLNGGKLNGVEIYRPDIWEMVTTNQVPEHIDTPRSCGWGVWTSDSYATPLNQSPDTCCIAHTGYTGTIIWMDKLSKTYVIMFTNCVFPVDKPANKQEIIKARKSVISTVLDHLEVYREYRNK